MEVFLFMNIKRRLSRQVKVGSLLIGGGAPISVQSMTNTDTRDLQSTLDQAKRLISSGCELIRVAVPDMEAASVLGKLKSSLRVPIAADVHFDYRLAIRALEQGVDKLRINPGNIGSRDKIRAVVKEAKSRSVPIRIGINSGSLEQDLLSKYGHASPEAMVESAMRNVAILEDMDFRDIVISVKASDPLKTIEAYKLIAERVEYPLHIGVTEAGLPFAGAIKSAIGIGILLWEGIGDTIRVSLTGDPVMEVKAGYEILKSLGLREYGPTIVSCPTCGRTEIDLISIAQQVEARLPNIKENIKIAIMGCIVNGPGEAREADIGIAGGKGRGALFKKGKVIRSVPEDELVDALVSEIELMLNEMRNKNSGT